MTQAQTPHDDRVSEARVKLLLADPCFSTAGLSLVVRDLQTGNDIRLHQPGLSLPPASVLKLLVTAAGLDMLGPDFRFQTELGYRGTLKGDTLQGDIVIKGYGDPTLGSRYFDQNNWTWLIPAMATSVKRLGLGVIKGEVIGDASYYRADRQVSTWMLEDMGNYYGAHCGGLNVHDNLFALSFAREESPDKPTRVAGVSPSVPDLILHNFVTTGAYGSGDQAYIVGAPGQHERFVRGTIPPGKGHFTIKGSLPDPAGFMASHLSQGLVRAGIDIKGGARSTRDTSVVPLHVISRYDSPPLYDMVRLVNQESVNLFAEGLGLYLQTIMQANDASWLERYWSDAGILLPGCRIADYAGLSPINAISSASIVSVLETMYVRESLRQTFLESLAVAGQTGTMRTLLKGTSAEGRVFAKSGSISGVRNYAGYMIGPQGGRYAFSLMTYNAACNVGEVRKKLEQLLESIYLSLPK